MQIKKNIVLTNLFFLFIAAFICSIISCYEPANSGFDISSIKTYKDIPGVTQEDITAIEALKDTRKKFVYGQMPETEAFILQDGTKAGFAIEFAALLSELFETEFAFEFHQWDSLLNGLNSFNIDFTGDLTTSPERMREFHMTRSIAERSQRLFTLYNDNSIATERDVQGRKIGYLAGSVDANHIIEYYPELENCFTAVDNIEKAVEMMNSGEISAFASAGVLDIQFAPFFNQVKSQEFFPLVYTGVSFSTANPDLLPFINVVDKYLEAGGVDVLQALYIKCDYDYIRYKLNSIYTEEERAYLNNLKKNNEAVKVALQPDNYPICFYNKKEKKFEGIACDIISEISILTGINFETKNNPKDEWSRLLEMLRTHEVSMISQLLYSQERDGNFIWADRSNASSRYALISRYDYPNISNFQVVRTKVGTIKDSAFEDKYNEWFPNNTNLITYSNFREVMKALESGIIDLVVGSDYLVLREHNYYENPIFKINILFHTPMDSYFGFNKNEEILCSVICKTLDYINNQKIVNNWTSRGYNYISKMNQQRLLYASVIAVITLFLLIRILFFNRRLNKLVIERTHMLEQQTIAAQSASQAKSTFLANMSHEIRTPMNAILGITEILLQDDTIPGKAQDALAKIYDSGDILMEIINDILDLSKIEAGKLELVQGKYDIPSLINDTIQLNRMRYEYKPVKFFLSLDENTPLNLYGDELRIKQILNNILSNAYKYTEEGKIEMSVCAEYKNNDEYVTLVFRISDTGQGMTHEQIDKLFDEYIRFNLEANRNIVGTGLGMSITKFLVDLMKGQLIVESKPGEGSVFTVRLPQKRMDMNVCGKETAEKLENFCFQSTSISKNNIMYREYMPHGSVLIVDDVKTNIFVTRGMLLPYGLKVDTASSGFEAIEKVKAGNKYDIIFMDHMMPKMDGIEATKIIREMEKENANGLHSSHTPIIALTANALVGQAEVFLDNGFDGYISKPIDTRELNQVLNEFIRNKKNNVLISANAVSQDKSEVEKFFVSDAEKAISVLEKIDTNYEKIEEAELNSFDIAVHGMKTALANIGEEELSAIALKLEKAAREKDFVAMAQITPGFILALKELINKFNLKAKNDNLSFSGNIKKTNISDEETQMLLDKLNSIKTACASYDIKSAKSALNELKQKTWPVQINDIIDEINVHLLHSAFAKAVSVIENALINYENQKGGSI